jgi:hypothetical protein
LIVEALQLSVERRIEKRGELLEILLARSRKKDNQQPSPVVIFDFKVRP